MQLLASVAALLLTNCITIADYGAKPDNATDNTAAIQKAIDDCSARGGGRVVVSGGVYKTYTLNLKNNVELHIERGATLKGGEDALKYPEFAPNDVWNVQYSPRWNKRAMFYTVGQTNVAITGHGTIDGNAAAFHERINGRWQRISDTNITGRCVFFVGCQDVRFDDVLIYHPCGWSTWFLDCTRVGCRGVRIECDRQLPNGDGLHFGGSRDVTVSDCVIDAQDDAIVVRTHQEQMKRVRPCERLTFANCVLRSNKCAIRFGWTEDGPIRDVSFDNIVCSYSRLGIQFKLPPLPDAPKEYRDPPRGRGIIPPPRETIVPFSLENVRFSNMMIESSTVPIGVDVAATENVRFMRHVSFSNCRFRACRPPLFACRPEDNVSDWHFNNVDFDIVHPRGTTEAPSSSAFANTRSFTFDNVRWNCVESTLPEWYLTLEQEGATESQILRGAEQRDVVVQNDGSVTRYIYENLSNENGHASVYNLRVVVEEHQAADETTYRVHIENHDPGITVTHFEGPYFARIKTSPQHAALVVPEGLGRRKTDFPMKRGYTMIDTAGFYPSTRFSMPWAAFEDGLAGTHYIASQGARATPRRLRLRWAPNARTAEFAFENTFFLENGDAIDLPESVQAKLVGDWHAGAKRYRRWYDGVREVRAATPPWTRSTVGWLLVIMKQQNEELMWPYTDMPLLCDVAEKNGLDCIGLFGWTVGGHDHLYPDYVPDEKMGGVTALKAGIAEAHRRGIKVYIYANGQLQQVGATTFWREHGQNLALVQKDGKMVIQTYHKYKDIPKYEFALGCLYGKPWFDRMFALAEQAESFGADGILYDQLGIFAPFACYGHGHGHPTPDYSYGVERPAFVRALADRIQKKNASFAVLTEGLHDTILDSVGIFHGCEFGTADYDGAFPELWAYTFPELTTSLRFRTPMISRKMANYAATYGFRHDLEVRYAPDRRYVLEGKVPKRADYGTVKNLPHLDAMAAVSPAEACAYLKAVCDFQRRQAKYLLTGRFVDNEGFVCTNPNVIAKCFVAADGSHAVCVWNNTNVPQDVSIIGLGERPVVDAPHGTSVNGLLAPQSIRLFVF